MFKVLVVEDSEVMRELIVYILESDPALHVIAKANNGEEAVAAAQKLLPDVITMDINMPKMDGFEATRRIMETVPKPIVIVSGSWDPKEVATSFRAMEAGAVAVLAKPPGLGHPDHAALAQDLVRTVKSMAEVKVVKRQARKPGIPKAFDEIVASLPVQKGHAKPIRLVAIGASTGGPMALKTLLSALPHPFPAPIAIVQHMAAGFISGFVDWLNITTRHLIHVAEDGESMLPGHVYVAPNALQMKVNSQAKIELIVAQAEHGLCPSATSLFRSVAQVYGPHAVGILLTGMGRDGAAELKMMRDAGAITFAQDKESSVVHGMPGEAIKLDAATYVLPPEKIASTLASIWNQQNRHLSSTQERRNDG